MLVCGIMLSGWLQASDWHTFTDTKGRQMVGQVKAIYGETAEVKLKRNFSTVTLRFSQLSEEDREYLKKWNEGNLDPGQEGENGMTETAVDRYHPRNKSDIKARIREISARKAPDGIDSAQQDAVNELNVYRYLCGINDNVTAHKEWIDRAQQAAEACQQNDKISHGLGSYTEKCNLSNGMPTVASTVKQYVTDAGANNREARGHRMWCLSPGLGRTGFGKKGRYSAMYVADKTGSKKPRDDWSYPGMGFFPLDRLHHNAWTYFSTENLPQDLSVEVYKIRTAPERPYSKSEEIPGKKLPTEYIKVLRNRVNFEPMQQTVGRGTYWVRVKSKGFHAGYLVDLY